MSSLEDRIAKLEAALAPLLAESRRGARLASSVDRLATEAGGLNAILAQVDHQQHQLTVLGHDIQRVKAASITTEMIEEKEEHARRARRRVALRTSVAITSVAAVLSGMLAYTINADYHACVDRQVRFNLQVSLYSDIAGTTPGPVADRIRAAAHELERSQVDCGDIYPVHWGEGD